MKSARLPSKSSVKLWIVFANQVGSIPLDWALGAFILQSTTTMEEKYEESSRSDWIDTIISEDSPILLLVAFILLTCIFTACYILRSGKTQFKTIYDLEKGRSRNSSRGKGSASPVQVSTL